jgi:hypothetical protein
MHPKCGKLHYLTPDKLSDIYSKLTEVGICDIDFSNLVGIQFGMIQVPRRQRFCELLPCIPMTKVNSLIIF